VDRGRYDISYVGYLYGHGGDALQMLQLSIGMQQLGARVEIVVPETETTVQLAERCRLEGIDCRRTTLMSVTTAGAHQRLPAVVQLLRSTSAPVVHFHTGNSCLPNSVVAAMQLLAYRRTFVTVHSPYENLAIGSLRARTWATLAPRRFEAVVSPSSHGTRYQQQLGLPTHLTKTVPNCVDVDAIRRGDPSPVRHELGVDASAPIVVFTSRLDGQKRPVDAVRVFAGVAEEFPSAVLVFVGQGDEEEAIRRESVRLGIERRVRLVGYRTDVDNWLAAATVWILPTERENFSLAVLEALAAGCPMLSTDCPGNDEVLVDGENALTFEVGDVATATHALRRLLADAPLRERLSAGARASADRFTRSTMVASYRQLYGSLPTLRSA
jgi:glycosyltransferase involved in cell wall biosynthesis